MNVEGATGSELIYVTGNAVGYLIIGFVVCVATAIAAATHSSTAARLFLLALSAGGLAQAVINGREIHRRIPLMRLDPEGLQAAVACLRWADLERIELKSDADDSHVTTIFVLRRESQLLPGVVGYNQSRGPSIKGQNLELYDWGDKRTLEHWFVGPITRTHQRFKFTLGT